MLLDDLGIGGGHNLRSPVGSLHLLRPAAQHVRQPSTIEAYLAFGGQTEPFFGTGFSLHFGHFDFLVRISCAPAHIVWRTAGHTQGHSRPS